MQRNEVYSCPQCQALNKATLLQTSILVCKSCKTPIADPKDNPILPEALPMPEDWSFLKVGSVCELPQQTFTLVGRCRLQLRNEYKNFWCAEYAGGKCLYLVESFGSFSIFLSPWTDYNKEASKLRAGKSIKISSDVTLTGEYVEKCEGLSFEGELGPWPFIKPGFFVVQASAGSKTAVFFIDPKKNIDYLSGEKITSDRLNFKNIIEWNEWK